eukprot:symbB.v1.2.002097.t1/scaffold114.1/size323002/3
MAPWMHFHEGVVMVGRSETTGIEASFEKVAHPPSSDLRWPELSLEDRLQALWEHVLAQQHEQTRREEEVLRLKKLLTQQRLDKDFKPNCWSCDQHLLDLDALLRALQRICLATMAAQGDRGDAPRPGTRPEKVIVGKVASTLTAVVNEIEESGGKATVQLKELAAYLAWVSVHSSSAARRFSSTE